MSRRCTPRAEKAVSGIKPKAVVARTEGQKRLIRTILDNTITICNGPAGTGKTHIAAGLAVAAKKRGEVERIIMTRPAVDSGASLGFLPGTMEEKIGPLRRTVV